VALPRLLVSSVVRGSQQGDSHGGLYLLDMDRGASEQVLDWNASGISWDGRGADRGLRGIAIVEQEIFIAASDELFVYDQRFRPVTSYRNPYLGHCHEISAHRGKLYVTSTGFDALLRMDLATRQFDLGLKLSQDAGAYNVRAFDPSQAGQAAASNALHINSVHADSTGVFFSGRNVPALVQITRNAIGPVASLPRGTHNARPLRGGVLFNDTDSDAVVWAAPGRRIAILVPRYDPALLTHANLDETHIARQAFGRGLTILSDNLIAAGSSPTTVSIHDLAAGHRVTSLNLSMDVRNAAHGLAVWPF